MGEENNDLQKKSEEQSTKKTLTTAAKAAATASPLGPAGGKLVDVASKTKVGDTLLTKGSQAANFVPGVGKLTNTADKVGALDVADKAVNVSNGNLANSNTNHQEKTNSNAKKGKNNSIGNSSVDSNHDAVNDSTFSDGSFSSKFFSFIHKHIFLFIAICGSIFFLLFFIVLIFLIIGAVSGTVIDFFSGVVNGIIDFFTKDQQELMDDYYKTLSKVQTDINRKYSICIDVNLITATLTINTSPDDFVEEGNESLDPETVTNDDGSTSEVPYKKMEKQVKLLANMQIMNQKYSLDQNLKSETGSYCRNETASELVTANNQSAFKRQLFSWMSEGSNIDSSTYELIASHDIDGLELFATRAFFTRKENDERNYAYYLYYPSFASDGTCSDSYAENLLPEDVPKISIGDSATRTESVYYWNLVNSFIPDYYEEYLPDKDDPTYIDKVKKMADEIYLLYEDLGPSQTCGASYIGPSSLCPNGIVVENVGTLDFEEYVAGVVSNEAYTSEGMEALKAQAVAARTYALKNTDYCKNPIQNSTNAQTFTKNINDYARQAVNETSGEILIDKDGNIFASQYDSFCYEDKDCPDAKRNSDGTYSVTYTKLPNGEKHTITLSDSKQYGRILSGQGHAHGMSQLVSYQMAKEGKTYQEILSYFYSDGVTISLVQSATTTDGASIIQGAVETYLSNVSSSVSDMNQYIFSQVRKAGVGTREGVVAAAVSLVSGFYQETGYKLPYELYPSGKYNGYGIDSTWGTNTGRSDYPMNGLDCSGFISWAIHNGGFTYDTRSAQGWGKASNSRSWSKGKYDDAAQPGDLIFNAPQSANGTTGHIKMIVAVTSDGYVVAEASSRNNGIRITNVSFTSTGPYSLVDMTNYYANASVVSDYPS